MCRFFLFSTLIVLLFSCKNPNSLLVLSGNLNESGIDSLILRGASDTILIGLDSNRGFADTLHVPAGYYDLCLGDSVTALYLKHGFRLNINFGKKVAFAGKGATENNYLQTKRELETRLEGRDNEHCFADLPEDQFLSLMDSLREVRLNLLDQNANRMDEEFCYIERNKLNYEYANKKALFETTVRAITGNMKFEVSADYYDRLFQDINLSDSLLFDQADYIQFMNAYLWQTTNTLVSRNDSIDFYYTYMTILNSKITSKTLKEKLSYRVGIFKLERTNRLDEVYGLVAANLLRPEYLQTVNAKYEVLKKIEKGAVSPGFQFKDVSGKLIALEDLRGKIVYIDIWSTGCVFCIGEMPYLNQIEAQYKGKSICFVGINIGDTEEDWKKALAERKLGGIQVRAESAKAAFFKDYLVRGIPRYILLDEQGCIINANALRPSDDKLKEQLDMLL